MNDHTPRPQALRLRRASRVLELDYAAAGCYALPWEYLRVYSPSAEVRGHTPEQAVLQTGKRHVALEQVRPVGNYAVQLVFDDGHDTGIYSWEYLFSLCRNHSDWWGDYLKRLHAAGGSRDPDVQVVQFHG